MCVGAFLLLVRSPSVSAVFRIAPGVRRLVPQPLTVQPFSDGGRVVSAARGAGGSGGGEGRPLATVTLDLDALGAPSVDLAHFDLLHVVARFGVLALRQRSPSSFSESVPPKRLLTSTRGRLFLPSTDPYVNQEGPEPQRTPALTIYAVA